MRNETLLLIDGFNLLSRGYFATAYGRTEEQISRNSKGIYTNALRVFFQKLLQLYEQHSVTHLAIAWDVTREETSRRQNYDFYKATRGELPDPLIQQYEVCKSVLESIGIRQLSLAPYEADDIIGTISKSWSVHSLGQGFIYSNDKDLFQLLSTNISQIVSSKKGEIIYTIKNFEDDYGITSNQWVDVKALLGDSSDNIPGCPGVGEKSALPLVQQYGSIEQLYEQIDNLDKKFNRYKKKLIEGKEKAFISKELSEIICNIKDLENMLFTELKLDIDKERMRLEFEKLELKIKIS